MAAQKTDPQTSHLGDELAQIISSETTVQVLVLLIERAASPKEIADELDLSTSNASYYVKKLRDLGFIELVRTEMVGNAVKRIYRAVVRPIVSTQDWAKLSVAERQRYSIWMVRMILSDAARSFQAEVFDARPNTHLSRTPMVVDEQGLTEVANIQTKALNEIIEVGARSSGRMAESGETGMNLLAAMMCFEMPEPTRSLSRSTTSDKDD